VSASLKIHPVFIGGLAPFDMVGGGDLLEIFAVAAESWEKVFKGGSGNWDVTIEFGWGLPPGGPLNLYAQEELLAREGSFLFRFGQ
jgi:hypothetical protein